MQETPVLFLVWEDPLEKGQATHSSIHGLPGGSDGKESSCDAGDLSSTSGLGGSPGGGHGNPLQYSGLENPHGQKSLAGYSSWGRKETDMTEHPKHTCTHTDNNLNVTYVLFHLNSEGNTISILTLQLRKLGHREGKELPNGVTEQHTEK